MKISVLVLSLISTTCFGQLNDSIAEKEIKQVVTSLFEGMKEGDSAKVRNCFIANPIMQSCFNHPRTGKLMLVSDSLHEFLNAVGMPHDKEWNEVPTGFEIKIDNDLMASAWVPYTFYLGEKYQHEGVDAFILVREAGKWKIAVLMDTRRVKKQ